MKRFVIGLLWMMLAVPCVLRAENPDAFREANTNYRTGNYEKAAELYRQMIRNGRPTAVFYYNLGNAFVRLEQLSEAVLAYEKGLLLDPRNRDIRQNLAYARGKLEYRVDDNRNWYLKVMETVLSRLTQTELNFTAMIFLALFLLASVSYFALHQPVFWGVGRRTLLVLMLIAFSVAAYKKAQVGMIRPSIVMVKECDARFGPSVHDQVAFRMGEGIKVFIMDRRDDWSRVLLTNGESGWVKNDDIAEIKI